MTEQTRSTLSERALRAAIEVAEEGGLRCEQPVVLRDRSNLLVHLHPAPEVARVATMTGTMRPGRAWLAREVAVARFDAAEAGHALRVCPEALRDFPGELPRLALLDELESIIERFANAGSLDTGDIEILRRVGAAVRRRIERVDFANSPFTAMLTWATSSCPPVGRCGMTGFGSRDPKLIAAAYGGYRHAVDAETLATFIDARRFQVSVWGIVVGQARSDRHRVEERLGWLREQVPRLSA